MDKRELEITAELANIELDNADIAKFASAVEQMIEYFEIMANFDDDATPTDHHQKQNSLRSDRAANSTMSDDILDQAPELEDRFIAIPNVL